METDFQRKMSIPPIFKNKRAVIVVPCFNEADRLHIDSFIKYIRHWPAISFVMVDDGSSDNTFPILETLKKRCSQNVTLVRQPKNKGKAEAVRQGVLTALTSNPDYFGYWDADLATPLNSISHLVSVLERRIDVDQVFGTRLSICGRKINRRKIRWFISSAFARAASLVVGHSFCDTQCGAKLFRTTPLTRAIFQTPFSVQWTFDLELMLRQVKLLGCSKRFASSVFELPLEQWDEIEGSKVRLHHFAVATKELIQLFVRYSLHRLVAGKDWSAAIPSSSYSTGQHEFH